MTDNRNCFQCAYVIVFAARNYFWCAHDKSIKNNKSKHRKYFYMMIKKWAII